MAQQPVDKRRVYLASRGVFTGDKAHIRKLKTVRKVVEQHKASLRTLIHDLGEEKTIEAVRDLLERRIFESELRAKTEFPELFHSSPSQEIQREASEIDAARSAAEAINEIASVEEAEADTDGEVGDATVVADMAGASNPTKPAILPSLYPIFIPYKAQHLILNEAQRLLEESCFEFLQKWLPSTLEQKGWECASSIELTKCTRVLARSAAGIPKEAFIDLGDTPLEQILFAANQLRHSAVHRLPNTARGVRDLCKSAVTLATTLGDNIRAIKLEEICHELDDKMETMKLNKNALEITATAGLEEIKRQREELDRREKEIVAQMVREDQENKVFMGVLLEESVDRILKEKPYANEVATEEREEQADENGSPPDAKGEPVKEKEREEASQRPQAKLRVAENLCVQSIAMTEEDPDPAPIEEDAYNEDTADAKQEHDTLKYSLLGPSLTKAGQDSVDQTKVSEIIYNASKGSKFFNREEEKDKILTQRINQILEKKRRLEKLDLSRELRAVDQLIVQLDASRDLTQHIVHVDCDAFYAAVEQLNRPELKDVPFAVGGGVLTTCNYVARKYGCRSGMAGFVAKKLCPELLLIPLSFDKYRAKAQEVREVLADYDPRFESASIDEAYLNITEYCREHGLSPEDAVQQMRDEIHEKTKITVSAGIAANAKLAKICSNMNKPNGQYILPSDRQAIMAFMRDLPTRKVNGVGRVLERELQEIGVNTCGDIYTHRHLLRQLFGEKTFEFLIRCYLGLGRTDIQPAEEYERKSVGTESTFRDMSDPVQLREKLRSTAEELEKDMRRAECKGRTLVLKVKLHTYEVFTRQVVTPRAIFLADDLFNYSLPILNKLQQEIPGMKLRLMGLRCTHLLSTKKPDTRAFFGLRSLRTESSGESTDSSSKRKASQALDGDESETGPMTTSTKDDTGDVKDALGSQVCDSRSGEGDNRRSHGKEIVPNPKRSSPEKEDDWWDCPICSRPQPTDERLFNDHIDLCLSRQAIRDTVQRESTQSPAPRPETPEAKRPKTVGDRRKKGRPSSSARPSGSADDPRQKRLFFG
ncbi:hypothetical protein DL762_000905 [Monosporascus cannonballus]|uniref:DNA polymerase kappa n=1 Tax=Monosporascus cannonballus TaxID=155416 RepID=A0ABY0HJ33_9PEZI|nr:hypothetical protein DL762_000905 [Monosporascus cannonballus]